MILYYDNLGKLNTIIPHGVIPRQGDSSMDLYIYFDKTYYNANYLNSGKSLFVRYKFESDLNFGPDTLISPVTNNYLTFQEIDSTERIGSLVNGTEYAVYKITINNINKAGKMSLAFSWKRGQGTTLVEEYLGKAEIYIEETLGFASDVGLGMTRNEYQSLIASLNMLDSNKADRVNQNQTIVLKEIKYDDYNYLKFFVTPNDNPNLHYLDFFTDYRLQLTGNEKVYIGSDNEIALNVRDNYIKMDEINGITFINYTTAKPIKIISTTTSGNTGLNISATNSSSKYDYNFLADGLTIKKITNDVENTISIIKDNLISFYSDTYYIGNGSTSYIYKNGQNPLNIYDSNGIHLIGDVNVPSGKTIYINSKEVATKEFSQNYTQTYTDAKVRGNSITLTGSSGILTTAQMAVITEYKNPIVYYINDNGDINALHYAFKNEVDTNEYVYGFNDSYIAGGNSDYRLYIENSITINSVTRAWEYVNKQANLVVKNTLDNIVDLLQNQITTLNNEIGYIVVEDDEAGTLTATQFVEAQKPYCIIYRQDIMALYYKCKENNNAYKFSMIKFNSTEENNLADLYYECIEVTKSNRNYIFYNDHYLETYNKQGIDARINNLQSQVDGINAGQNLADIVANLTALGSMSTTDLQVGDKVQVLADSNHSSASTVYSWNGTTAPNQNDEYVVNGTGYFIYVGEYGQDSYKKAETYSQTEINALLALKQNLINALNMLNSDYVDDVNSIHKFVTAADKTNWNGKLNASNVGIVTISADSGTLTSSQLDEIVKNISVIVYGSKRFYKVDTNNGVMSFLGDTTKTSTQVNQDLIIVNPSTGAYSYDNINLITYQNITSSEINALFS